MYFEERTKSLGCFPSICSLLFSILQRPTIPNSEAAASEVISLMMKWVVVRDEGLVMLYALSQKSHMMYGLRSPLRDSPQVSPP